MGLDMYLEKYPRMGLEPRQIDAVEGFARWLKKGREHPFDDWCGYHLTDLPDAQTLGKLLGMVHVSYYAWDDEHKYPTESISEQVGYWRKANAIHRWFVENVQDGEDDCDYHRPVTKEDLQKLLDLCRSVLNDRSEAGELLPVERGFFFGSYDYDEWYFSDIAQTAQLCERLISEFDFDNYDLYYRSSW